MNTTIEGEPPITAKNPTNGQLKGRRVHTGASKETLQIKTILVPLDFSGASMQALRYTIRLAESFGAAIHLVHVQPTDELATIAQAGHMMLDAADAVALMQDRLAEIRSGTTSSSGPITATSDPGALTNKSVNWRAKSKLI